MKNKLIMSYPSSLWTNKWKDALPLGNGEIGVSVYGGVYNETILINHEDLWADNVNNPLPDVSYCLSKIRGLLAEEKIVEAQEVFGDELKAKEYETSIASPLPLGDLKICMPVNKPFKNYSRILDMEKGEATVQWEDDGITYKRQTFVSRADNTIAFKMTSNKAQSINQLALTLTIHDKNNAYKPFGLGQEDLPDSISVEVDKEYIYYSATYKGLSDFGGVAKIKLKDGQLKQVGEQVLIEGCSEFEVLIKVFVKGERRVNFIRLRDELENITQDYETLLERHVAKHRPLFLSAQFQLTTHQKDYSLTNEELLLIAYKQETTDEMIEKMWAFGRYLLICASREVGKPCPLLGLWHGDYRAYWSFNMLNENIQMIYWQALTGNMPELLLAVFDYYESMMDDLRENAKQLYGCRGIFIPAVSTPGVGKIQCTFSHIINWTAGAGWLGQHYYDYYLYTGDKKFLEERAIPFLKEVALFYEDFFTLDERGYYVSSPSVSPENAPANYFKNTFEGYKVTMNATMDFAIAKEVLTHLIEGCKLLGIEEHNRQKWEKMLGNIPPYEINEDGAIKEWQHPYFKDNYEHRHQSHIYPIFPGCEITKEETPELFEAFVIALKKRLNIGLTSQTGWSFAHMACNYARMMEGDLALECIDNICRSSVINNFFTLHNDWRSMGIGMDMDIAPFQIDANMGITAAINEMLLFSKAEFIKILPALPQKWTKGYVTGLAAKGALIVDLKWDMEVRKIEVKLKAKEDKSVKIIIPYELKAVTINQLVNKEHSDHVITCSVLQGESTVVEIDF